MILLVAMVAAMLTVLRKRKDTKTVEATMQLCARAQDRVNWSRWQPPAKAGACGDTAKQEEKKHGPLTLGHYLTLGTDADFAIAHREYLS